MPGGQGRSESRQLLARVMVTVLVVNAAASMLGQAYSDLIRPAGSRAWTPPGAAVGAGVLAMLVALLVLTRPPFRRLVGAPLTARHVVCVLVVFIVVSGIENLIAPAAAFAHRSRLTTLAID